MRWKNRESSQNIEDRRGESRGGWGGLGGMGGSSRGVRIPVRGKSGVALLVIVMVAGYYGIDLTPLLTGGGTVDMTPQTRQTQPYQSGRQEQELAQFISVALKTTEDTWAEIFQKAKSTYENPKLVLYTGTTSTACGYGQAAMGPFYCPGDRKVYLDLSFYDDMKKKYGGGGDFALGYVLAHEVGHHVQTLIGVNAKVRQMQNGASRAEANRLSVRMELQADCFAGVWGNYMKRDGVLEEGDLEKALKTASAIGDDRLQKQSTGRVVPDSFTHGTSEQRYNWFMRGYESGNPGACNTFATGSDSGLQR